MGFLDKLSAAFRQEPATVDPAEFDSALASTIDWTPLAPREGAGARTYRLQTDDTGSQVFVSTLWLDRVQWWHLAGLAALELAVVALILFRFLPDLPNPIRWRFFGVLTASAVIGTVVFPRALKRSGMTAVFSREDGAYFRHVAGKRPEDVTQLPDYTRFRDIAALQLLGKVVRSSQSRYFTCELNLVRRDGSRVPVVSHRDHHQLAADAATLAATFGVPLWDAVAAATD